MTVKLTASSPAPVSAELWESRLSVSQISGGTLLLSLAGDWKLRAGLPSPTDVGKHLDAAGSVRRLAFDVTQLGAWDSGLLAFLVGVQDLCKTRGIQMDPGALPEGGFLLAELATFQEVSDPSVGTVVAQPLRVALGDHCFRVGVEEAQRKPKSQPTRSPPHARVGR
jgi:hypothetical protein